MSYYLEFTDKAKEDIASHKKAGNKLILNKLFVLLNELTIHPHTGTGKPEMLRFSLSGLWSRRINYYSICQRTLFLDLILIHGSVIITH